MSIYRPVLSCFLLAIAMVAILATPVRADEDLDWHLDIQYERFTLDNGLTVLVHSDHSVPTVFVGMWYGVGSKDEPEGKSGFAHLFEHLMFQSSENRDGEYLTPFTDAGAVGMNGTTSEDRTNYFATIPTGALDMALWMESDRMANFLGAVTQDVLDEQRSVVENEKRQAETKPYGQSYNRVRSGIYPVDHPYRHVPIGSMEDLNAASLEDVQEWFKTYYGGSNAVLVLAGDVTLEDAKTKVQHFFNEAPPGKPLSRTKQWVPSIPYDRVEHMYDRVGSTVIFRAYAIPGLNAKETALFPLITESLFDNKNAPIRKRLVDELQLATDVTSFVIPRTMSGEIVIVVDLRSGANPDEVISVIDDEISAFISNGPDVEIVDSAKLESLLAQMGAIESMSGVGFLLAEGQLYSNEPLFINKKLQWTRSATPEELRDIAGQWLARNYYQLTVEPFPKYIEGESVADRSAIPEVTEVGGINFPETRTTTLKNGMKVVVANRGSVPLVDVWISFDTGITAAPADAPRIGSYVFRLLDKGTENSDASKLARAMAKIGMSPLMYEGQERSTFRWKILRSKLADSLGLAAEMLATPSFPQDELDSIKAQQLNVLATLEKAPANAADSLFRRAIYGVDSPVGQVWTPGLVEQVAISDLRDFHSNEIAPDNMTVYMIGNIGFEEATAAIDEAFSSWTTQSNSARQRIGDAPAAEPRVILVDYPGAASSLITAGHSIPAFDPDTWNEMEIMNWILGGNFESRLNMNLREDKGWSYGYHSTIRRNASGDMFIQAKGKVQSDKTKESMQEILKEFESFLSNKPATDVEVERAKLNLTRSLPGTFSVNHGFLSSMVSSDTFGLPLDYEERTAERVLRVSTNGVNARARALIKPEKLTWLVVGDLDEFEEEVRSLNLGPVEVWDAFGNSVNDEQRKTQGD